MKRILPEYGIKVIEIPRAVNEEGEIISATNVRRILDDCLEELRKLVPENEIEDLLVSYYRSEDSDSVRDIAADTDRMIEINGDRNLQETRINKQLDYFFEDKDFDIFVFGAGKWGMSLLRYLGKLGYTLKGFVVDDEYVEKTRLVNSCDVLAFSELNALKHKVIIATSRKETWRQLLEWRGIFLQLPEWFLRKISGTERI